MLLFFWPPRRPNTTVRGPDWTLTSCSGCRSDGDKAANVERERALLFSVDLRCTCPSYMLKKRTTHLVMTENLFGPQPHPGDDIPTVRRIQRELLLPTSDKKEQNHAPHPSPIDLNLCISRVPLSSSAFPQWQYSSPSITKKKDQQAGSQFDQQKSALMPRPAYEGRAQSGVIWLAASLLEKRLFD